MTPTAVAVQPPPPPWEATRASGMVLRSLLDAMGEWEPDRAVGVLREAGLERPRFALPPSASGGITQADLAALYGIIHARFGETLSRSFLTAHGRALGERWKSDVTFLGVRREGDQVPAGAERLAWAVRTAARLLSEPSNELVVEETRDELLLTREHCPLCAKVASARAPICATVEEALTGIIRDLSGVRATALEIDCHALGAERCRFRVRR